MSTKSRLRARFHSGPLDVGVVDVAPIRGTESEAVQAADGTWTIKDVPIFADTTRDYRDQSGKTLRYVAGGDWHAKAIARAQARYAETGYMSRVIVRHTAPGKDREGAGFVMPRRVGTMTVDGEAKSVLFADYIGVPDHIYQRMKRHELPYRSAETPLDGRPEIKALALLPSEEPFHPFGPHTIRREVRHVGARPADLRESPPVFHFKTSGARARLTLRFKMPETTTTPAAATTTTTTAAPAAAVVEAAPVATNAKAEPVATHEAPAGSVESKIDKVLALLQQLVGDEATEGEAVAEPGEDPKTGDPTSKMAAEYEGKIARFTADLAALKAERDALVAEKASAATRAKAVATLKARNVPGDHDKIVGDALARFKSDEAMLAFVEGFASNLPEEPTEAPLKGVEASAPAAQGDVLNFSTEYDTFAASGSGYIPRTDGGKPMTKDQYIASRKATLGSK